MGGQEGGRLDITSRYSSCPLGTNQISHIHRYRTTSLLPVPYVVLRPLQSRRHSGHAHSKPRLTLLTQGLQFRINNKKQTTGTLLWQITNQSLNVAINSANANKSTALSTS